MKLYEKISEQIIKLIFIPRVKKANKIAEAAKLIENGNPHEALSILDKMGNKIPPYLGFLYFLTQARAYDELKDYQKAEHSYLGAALLFEGANLAYLHLAVLYGKMFKFDEARTWLNKIIEYNPDDLEGCNKSDNKLKEQAKEIQNIIEQIELGEKEKEIQNRASSFASQNNLDFSYESIEKINDILSQETTNEELENIALYLGEICVKNNKAAWKISLALEESYVESENKNINPFMFVKDCIANKSKPPDFIGLLKK